MNTEKPKLTDKQQEVLDFLRTYYEQEDRLPVTRIIKARFGWNSQTSAITHLRALERKGYLDRRNEPETGGMHYRFARPTQSHN